MMMMLLIQWVTTTARSALIGEDDWPRHIRTHGPRLERSYGIDQQNLPVPACGKTSALRDRLMLGADNKTYQQRRIIETDITINQTHIPDGTDQYGVETYLERMRSICVTNRLVYSAVYLLGNQMQIIVTLLGE